MSKEEFLGQLRKGLSGLPQDDREERLAFYSEMLDDRLWISAHRFRNLRI